MLRFILLVGLTIKSFPDAIYGQTITSPPVHFTGTVGGNATFTCQVKFTGVRKFFSWEFNNNPVYIHQYDIEDYPLGEKKYSVEKGSGTFTLTVTDLVHNDGGLYACLLLGHAETAVLFVLGIPHLFTSPANPIEGSETQLICTAKIGGPKREDILSEQYPKLQMFLNSESLEGQLEVQQLHSSTNILNLTQIHNVTLESKSNGNELTCKIETLSPPVLINVTTVTNVTVLRPTENPSFESENDSWIIAVGITIPVLLIITMAFITAFCCRTSLRKIFYQLVPSEDEEMKMENIKNQGDAYNVQKMIDPDATDDNVEIALDQVVLNIPSKSVAKRIYVSVKEKDNFQTRQQQIESSGLANILTPVMQLSLEPPGLKLSQSMVIEVKSKVPEDSKVLVLSRIQEDNAWTDITDTCEVDIKKDGILFNTGTFADFEVLLSGSSREDASSLACTLLNKENTSSSVGGKIVEEETANSTEMKTDKKQKSKNERLLKIINNLKCCNELDEATAEKIKQFLKKEKSENPTEMCSPLIKLLEKADILIESNHFVGVCKEAAQNCLRKKEQMHEDPLLVLVEKLEKDDSSHLTQYPEKLLKLTEILQQFDGSNDTRNRCIRVLIMNTIEWRQSLGEVIDEKDKSSSTQLQWSSDLINVLKGLEERGADLAWSPGGSSNGSNLYLVMATIKYVKCCGNNLFGDCMDLMDVMMTKSPLALTNTDGEGMTLLHSLVDGRKIPLLPDYADQLSQIISLVQKKNSDLIDNINNLKHAPLHTFMTSVLNPRNIPVENERHLFTEVANQWRGKKEACLKVVTGLTSPSNKDIQSREGKTPLHDLIESVDEWQDHPDTFLEVVRCVRSDSNIDFHGKNVKTPLFEFLCKTKKGQFPHKTFLEVIHCLKSVYNIDYRSQEISTPLFEFTTGAEEWAYEPAAFFEVVKHLKSPSNIDFVGPNGCTPLHKIISTTTNWVGQQDAILQLFKYLKSTNNIIHADENGCTPLHLITSAAAKWANHPEKFLQVIQCLKPNSNEDLISKSKNTPLSNFTSATGEWANYPHTFLDVIKCLKPPANIDFQNENKCTPLHLVTSNARKWQNHPAMYIEVIKWLKSACNVNLQNEEGNTPLMNFIKDAMNWTSNISSIIEVVNLLKSPFNINLQNKNRNTPLHQLTFSAAEWAKHLTTNESMEVVSKFLDFVNGLISKDNIDFVNAEGFTPIHNMTSAAVEWKQHADVFLEIVKKLVSPTNSNIQTKHGDTPLHHVTRVAGEWVGNSDVFLTVVSCLITSSNIDVQNKLGCTPLHNVACNARLWAEKLRKFLKIVECLISPLNVNLKDNQGNTALCVFNKDIKILQNMPKSFSKVAGCLKTGKKSKFLKIGS